MPPTAFVDLLESDGLVPDDHRARIDALLTEKATAPEWHHIQLEPAFLNWLTGMREEAEAKAETAGTGRQTGLDPLDELMIRCVLNPSLQKSSDGVDQALSPDCA